MLSHYGYFLFSFLVRSPFGSRTRTEWITHENRTVHVHGTKRCYKQTSLMKASFVIKLPLLAHYI